MGKWKSFCAAGVLFCLVAVVVFCWLRMPVSDQELLANFAKAGDFFRGVESVQGAAVVVAEFSARDESGDGLGLYVFEYGHVGDRPAF